MISKLKGALIYYLGFWERQRAAFFDIRVCHPNADSYRDLSPKKIYRIHENEKKRKYNSRVTEIEQGTFTPLVFTTTGGMADECLRYHARSAELLSAKQQENYATTISWVRAKVSFAILRSALLCLRGSRTPRRRNLDVEDRDLGIWKGSSRTSLDSTAMDALWIVFCFIFFLLKWHVFNSNKFFLVKLTLSELNWVLFKSTGIVNRFLNELVFFFFFSKKKIIIIIIIIISVQPVFTPG